ncbi:manganese/iron superoxide dismutase, partial [Kipferlia bialata]
IYHTYPQPAMSAHQLDIHYNKHHQGYCNKTNAALLGEPLAEYPIEYVLDHLDELPEEKRQKVTNVGGGLANHSLFWECLTPETGMEVPPQLKFGIEGTFGSMDALKTSMVDQGMSVFGSGWVWLFSIVSLSPSLSLSLSLSVSLSLSLPTPLMSGMSVFGSGWVWLVKEEDGHMHVKTTMAQDRPKGNLLLTLDVWEHAYYLDYENRRKEYLETIWEHVNWDNVASRFE